MRADARAQYGTVMDAIDDVRTAGVDQVGLLTDRRQDHDHAAAGRTSRTVSWGLIAT